MPFLVQRECPCCRDMLHHCKKCWDRFHNGQKHNDYVEPKYFGESMTTAEVIKRMEELGIKHNPTIKADESKAYKEGIYH